MFSVWMTILFFAPKKSKEAEEACWTEIPADRRFKKSPKIRQKIRSSRDLSPYRLLKGALETYKGRVSEIDYFRFYQAVSGISPLYKS